MYITFLAIQKFITSQLKLKHSKKFSRGQAVVSFVKSKQLIFCCSICLNTVDTNNINLRQILISQICILSQGLSLQRS